MILRKETEILQKRSKYFGGTVICHFKRSSTTSNKFVVRPKISNIPFPPLPLTPAPNSGKLVFIPSQRRPNRRHIMDEMEKEETPRRQKKRVVEFHWLKWWKTRIWHTAWRAPQETTLTSSKKCSWSRGTSCTFPTGFRIAPPPKRAASSPLHQTKKRRVSGITSCRR